jgi:hypothetical protein
LVRLIVLNVIHKGRIVRAKKKDQALKAEVLRGRDEGIEKKRVLRDGKEA